MTSASEVPERRQYLAFALAGGDYAVGILKVKEILQFEEITTVPSTPRSIRGVLNLRGSVVPVVDLALKLGLPEIPVTGRTCVLVVETGLEGGATVMGLMVDAVSEVLELGADDVEEPPTFGPRVKLDYLLGIGKVRRKFVLLLDIDKIISADERELAFALEHPPSASESEAHPADRPGGATVSSARAPTGPAADP